MLSNEGKAFREMECAFERELTPEERRFINLADTILEKDRLRAALNSPDKLRTDDEAREV